MRTYKGQRNPADWSDKTVWVEDDRSGTIRKYNLPRCLHVRSHSPDGFEWGYGGSGPAQLALAILVDLLQDDKEAERHHQKFKWAFIAKLKQDEDWDITEKEIRHWLDAKSKKTPAEQK